MSNAIVDLDDTETGFKCKSYGDLKKARFLFSVMNVNWLVKAGAALIPLALKIKLPVKRIIDKTIFQQFVGGQTLNETLPVLDKLSKYNVKSIMDYGAEGKESEESFAAVCEEFIRLIKFSAGKKDIAFISIKVTGLARFALLEKQNLYVKNENIDLALDFEHLDQAEIYEWEEVLFRLDKICKYAREMQVGVLVDAEESWIQDTIDALAVDLMRKYNRKNPVVFNTIQFYRIDRMSFLVWMMADAESKGYIPGIKIVRGAYMEKEQLRAIEENYPSPIQSDKNSTDRDFNNALRYCVQNLEKLILIVASHNDDSVRIAVKLLAEFNYPKDHPNMHFSQLYGMSDNITFNLAKTGYRVSKYLPYGPLEDVIPYLMRRAQENTSVSSQTGRELSLINKEVTRRKLAGAELEG